MAGAEEVVGVDGEMGPGEGADAEVDDGGRRVARRSARERRRLDPASLPTAARRSWSDVASWVVQPSRRVTIEDVAAHAGVHAGTVSRALNRPEQVAPATRERIETIVRELDFVPNRAARGLITGRTDNVAVIVPDITNPTFAALVRAAGRQLGMRTSSSSSSTRASTPRRRSGRPEPWPTRSTGSWSCRLAACTGSWARWARPRPSSSTAPCGAGRRW